MSDFTDLIKEAMRGGDMGGAGSLDDLGGRQALETSLQQFDRRLRTVRGLSWFLILSMFAVSLYTLYSIIVFEGEDVRTLVLLAVVFLWANSGVGMGKMWFWQMQNDIAIRKELKRVQLQLLDMRERGA